MPASRGASETDRRRQNLNGPEQETAVDTLSSPPSPGLASFQRPYRRKQRRIVFDSIQKLARNIRVEQAIVRPLNIQPEINGLGTGSHSGSDLQQTDFVGGRATWQIPNFTDAAVHNKMLFCH